MSERDEEQEWRDNQLRISLGMNIIEENKLKPKGVCHWCEEPVILPEGIYCCPECGIDHEKWQKANVRM